MMWFIGQASIWINTTSLQRAMEALLFADDNAFS